MKKNTIDILITQTINGDKDSQSKLYEIYRKKINSFLLNKYNSNNDHIDDVSEILLKIFENLKKYDSNKSKFDTWVYLIAKNYMIDKSRKRKPIYVSFTSNTLNNDDDQHHSNNEHIKFNMLEPVSYYQQPDVKLEISDSIDYISTKISNDDLSMLKMKYVDGYTYNEIGEKFNINQSKALNKVNSLRYKINKGDM